jgi:hypothetical protein
MASWCPQGQLRRPGQETNKTLSRSTAVTELSLLPMASLACYSKGHAAVGQPPLSSAGVDWPKDKKTLSLLSRACITRGLATDQSKCSAQFSATTAHKTCLMIFLAVILNCEGRGIADTSTPQQTFGTVNSCHQVGGHSGRTSHQLHMANERLLQGVFNVPIEEAVGARPMFLLS